MTLDRKTLQEIRDLASERTKEKEIGLIERTYWARLAMDADALDSMLLRKEIDQEELDGITKGI